MSRLIRQWLTAAGVACVLLSAAWVYYKFGGILVRSDSLTERNSGIFYRVIVRRIPFTADFAGDGAVVEASLLFNGSRLISSQIFRWDSWSPESAKVLWSSQNEFFINFGSGTVRGFHCRFSPWQSTEWNIKES